MCLNELCACLQETLRSSVLCPLVRGLGDIQTFAFFHILQMQRRGSPPPFPEVAGHRPKATQRTSFLVAMGAAKLILLSVAVHCEKGQDCACKGETGAELDESDPDEDGLFIPLL